MSTPRLTLSPRRVAFALAIVAATLMLGSVLVHVLAFSTGHDHMMGLRPLLDLDKEANLPSLFSALLLVLVGALLALVALVQRQRHAGTAHWWVLAAIAAAMGVDEAASVHELLIEPTRRVLGGQPTGVLHFAWVVPGALVVAAFLVAFWRFHLRLPQPLRGRVQLAGLLYLGGALGVELLAGRHVSLHGADNLAYAAGLVTLEEGLELAGVLVAIHALLHHLAQLTPALEVHLSGTPTTLRARQARPRLLPRRLQLPPVFPGSWHGTPQRRGGLRPPSMR